MIDEVVIKAITEQVSTLHRVSSITRFQKESDKLAATFKAFEENSAIKRIAEDFARHEQMMRAALGPVEELRRAGAFDFTSQIADQLKPMQSVLTEIEERFRLPEMGETVRLLQGIESTGVASALRRYHDEVYKIQEASLCLANYEFVP